MWLAQPVCDPRRNGQDCLDDLSTKGLRMPRTSRGAGGYAQGLLRAGERCSTAAPGSCGARIARAGRSTTRCYEAAIGHDLRRGGQRVARRRRLARARDLGETWQLSSEGLTTARAASCAVEGLGHVGRARPRACGRRGARASSRAVTAAQTWSLLSTLDGQPGRELWNVPANQPPGHLGLPRSARTPTSVDTSGSWSRASASSRRPTTAPRGRRATTGCAPTGRSRIPRTSGFCVHKLVMSPVDTSRLYQQNHVGMHCSDDGGR